MQSNLELRVVATTRIAKFAEGQNPETDEPFETVEKEIVFTGEEARKILDSIGGTPNGIN